MKRGVADPPATLCYHCGEHCENNTIRLEEKTFCCNGCKMVYELINKVNLCEYYELNKNPGASQKHEVRKEKFAFLDDDTVQSKLVHFKDNDQSHVVFYLPQMHCSSCVWLLENLNKLNKGIIQSRVDFLKKEISVSYAHGQTSLRQIAEVLTSIGYEPHISLNDLSGKKIKTYNRQKIYKIGIAGFCFGNIMMMSFPEYFSSGNLGEAGLKELFSWINLGLSLPVFFYCASDFFVSAWKSLKQKFLNIDAPIALAILITFSRSVYEIITGSGPGYLDSMSGIVFFMLVGRFFQDKTYNTLTFNRDYTSYFPLGVTVINDAGEEKQIPVSKLKKGERIKIHSHEIVPADSILFLGKANIDYSFVTGESLPVEKSIGEIVYAGGKQSGAAIELEVIKEVSQSYLTQLWNNEAFKKEEENENDSFIHLVSRYFTIVLFSIAAASAVYWYINDPDKILNAVTAILIVACPCALLLSATFTNGNMLKVLQHFGFYAKNAAVLERIKGISAIVFDKTGTITLQGEAKVVYSGSKMDQDMAQLIRSLAGQSSHPLSRAIVSSLPFSRSLPVKNFREEKGMGISGTVNGNKIFMGSAGFVYGQRHSESSGEVFVNVNNRVLGSYAVKTKYRSGLKDLIDRLGSRCKLFLISGDNESERPYLQTLFGKKNELLFNQKPADKLEYIARLKREGNKVMMIGDGLNDAGALKQSDVGVAVTDNINNFSPACDVILDGKSFGLLGDLIEYCGKGKRIIIYSFIISILYNIAGLYFAFFGMLQPVIAAILMPLSSITIILFTTGLSTMFSYQLSKQYNNDNNNKSRQS